MRLVLTRTICGEIGGYWKLASFDSCSPGGSWQGLAAQNAKETTGIRAQLRPYTRSLQGYNAAILQYLRLGRQDVGIYICAPILEY